MTKLSASVSSFWSKQEHSRILLLTFPMILANITTPLIGLVDTAVLGHMSGTHHLAGASIAALVITQLYWICGFIRMSATGLSAQAKGKKDSVLGAKSLYQGMLIGASIGFVTLLLRDPLLNLGIQLTNAQPAVQSAMSDYFHVRVLGAPAALMNLALIGWLIGQQKAKKVLYVQVIANLLNAALDLYFVYGLGWGIKGVAFASLCAEYFILCASFVVAFRLLKRKVPQLNWFQYKAMKGLLGMNTDMLIRNLALQLCLAFVTIQGARLGQTTAAVNAILMQFFVLIALGLDGVAYAVEALVGEGKGQGSARKIEFTTYRGLFWSSILAAVYAITFYVFGEKIMSLLTDNQNIISHATSYLWIILSLPLIAHWCFLYDGVFIGLTRAKAMKNSMLLSGLLVFFPTWMIFSELQNSGLWIALLAFMAARGIVLAGYFTYLSYRRSLTC